MEALEHVLAVLKNTDWDKAEKMIFESYRMFLDWVGKSNAEVLWMTTTGEEDVVNYYVMVKSKPVVAVVRLTVDDFYIPNELAEAKLNPYYITEKAENYEWAKPAVVCKDLHDLFYTIIEISAKAKGFASLSPDEAQKLLEMVSHVIKACKILKECVEEGIKGYVASVAMGLVKDERWECMDKKEE